MRFLTEHKSTLRLAEGLALPLCFVVLLAGCEDASPAVISGDAMGTRYHVTLGDHRASADAIDAEVAGLLDAIEEEASPWRSLSWVSTFNASDSTEAVRVPGHVWAMLRIAERVHRESGGALDITVGPLVELWGFGASPSEPTPTKRDVEEALQRCGMDKLVLDHGKQTLRKLDPMVTIDLSSLAKGYAVDRIAELLDARGVDHYLVAFGGEVRAKGDGPGGAGWVVGVDRKGERDGDARSDRITLNDEAVATSGGGQQRRELPDGRLVTHLIDPRTGMAVMDVTRSVTVVADRAALADAWATALSVTPVNDRGALAQRGGVRVVEPR